MKIAKQNLNLFFPTPVWSAEMEGYEPVHEAIRQELAKLDWQTIDQQHHAKYSEHHSFTEDRFITVEQAPTIGTILELFMQLCKQIGEELNWDLSTHPLLLTSYWVHATEPGGITQTHSHKPSLLSGVYYVDKPENSGDLVFVDENPYHAYGAPVKEGMPHPLGDETVAFPAKEGTMLIFPSWLSHRVAKNRSGKRRLSLSFNAALGHSEPASA